MKRCFLCNKLKDANELNCATHVCLDCEKPYEEDSSKLVDTLVLFILSFIIGFLMMGTAQYFGLHGELYHMKYNTVGEYILEGSLYTLINFLVMLAIRESEEENDL